MNISRLLGLLVVVMLSVVGAYFVSLSTQAIPQTTTDATPSFIEPDNEELSVLVAKKSMKAGSFIDQGDVTWRAKAASQLVQEGIPLEGWIESEQFSLKEFNGAVVLSDVEAGSTLVYGNVVRPQQQGFLAAVLSPGHRAISIPVNEVTANAGLIGPGDHVDVLLTFYADSNQGAKTLVRGRDVSMLTSKTLASAIRVIAINRQSVANRVEKVGDLLTTATLEVSPTLAQKFTLATHMGELALSLRSKRAPGYEMNQQEIWSGDVHSASNQLKPDPGLVLMRGGVKQVIGYPQKEEKEEEE